MLLKMLKVIPALLLSFTVLLSTPAIATPSVNKAQALKVHNTARAKDKQRPLQWSPDLENISQKWANQLASTCKVYHHQGDIPFGENLFISTATTKVGQAVNAWVNERAFTITHKINAKQANNVATILKLFGKARQM